MDITNVVIGQSCSWEMSVLGIGRHWILHTIIHKSVSPFLVISSLFLNPDNQIVDNDTASNPQYELKMFLVVVKLKSNFFKRLECPFEKANCMLRTDSDLHTNGSEITRNTFELKIENTFET